MKVGKKNRMLLQLLLCVLLFAGFEANALSYDYTASIECLAKPQKPQYKGGIITNPELNQGLKGWSRFGNAKIEHRESDGNKFIVAHSRNQPYDTISQKLYLQKSKLYTFSAWIQVSEGNVPVTAIFKTSTGFKYAGAVVAEPKCWSMLKGGLTVDASGPAELYFESKNTSVEIWVDSISLQPFTQQQWKSHQDESIHKMRKNMVKIQALDEQGKPLANTNISIQQKRLRFPFGCAINKNILTNAAYRNWFSSKGFTVTTFEDEMKWYCTEPNQNREDYSVPDAMLQFAKQNHIGVRGHNVFWDDPRFQPHWVNWLSPPNLRAAAHKRANSIIRRYKGQLIAWDVVNENLHFSFLESKLGRSRGTASGMFYGWAEKIDRNTPMFMNDFNTLEEPRDGASTPAKYLAKLRQIQSCPGNKKVMGIGLESHFGTPNIPYMRASIDTLAATGLPIWLTEVDVQSNPKQAQFLEQILREAHAHPKVGGIVIWAAWKPQGCYRMCLTDNNFRNLATGFVVDKLLREWGAGASNAFAATTDADGFFEASLFHGDYELKIADHPAPANSSIARSFKVDSTEAFKQTLRLQVSA